MALSSLRNRAVLTFYNLDLVNDTGIQKTLLTRMHKYRMATRRPTVLPQLSETAKDALTLDDASFLLVPSFL